MARRVSKPVEPVTVAEAAATEDRLTTLRAMRARLARAMDEAPDSVVAQVSARLSAVIVEIDQLTVGAERSGLDEIKARREARMSANVPASPARAARQRR